MELVANASIASAKHIWDALQASIEVNIQNQCSNFELTLPIYFCDNAVCDETPNQRVPSEDSTAAKFRVKFSRFMLQGAILYEVRATSTPSNETDANNSMAVTNGSIPVKMQFLVAWKISRHNDPFLFIALLEHGSNFTWNEGRLRQLFEEHSNRLRPMSGRSEATWLMQDGIVLKTEMGTIHRRQYKLKVIVSDVKDKHTTNAIYYEPKT
jgi:hypothetical protein